MFFVHSACEGITIFALVAQLMERSVLQAQGMRIVQYFKMDSSWLLKTGSWTDFSSPKDTSINKCFVRTRVFLR